MLIIQLLFRRCLWASAYVLQSKRRVRPVRHRGEGVIGPVPRRQMHRSPIVSVADIRVNVRALAKNMRSPNPLWSYLSLALGSDQAARRAVFDAIESLAKAQLPRIDAARALVQAAIIVYGELGGRTNAQVARALGISIRRLYRERRVALRRLTLVIDERVCKAVGSNPHVALSLFDLEVLESDIADRSGNPELAIAKLRSVLEQGIAGSRRAAILGRLVGLYARHGSHAMAERALSEARQALRPESADANTIADIELAETQLSADVEDRTRLRVALERLVATRPPEPSPLWLETFASALAELAATQIGNGDIAGALETIIQIDNSLAEHPEQPIVLRVRTMILRAQIHVTTPETIGLGRAEANAALHLAGRNALIREAWDALHTLVDHHFGSLDLPSVLAYGRHLLAIAQRIGEPRRVVMASLIIAATEAQLGRLEVARRRVEACSALTSPRTELDRDLLHAYVRLNCAEYIGATELLERARTRAEQRGLPNYAGVSFLYTAQIFKNGGDQRKALDAAFAAMSVLESGTSPYHLASAYRRLYDLTSQHRYRRRAEALSASCQVTPNAPQLSPLANLRTERQTRDDVFGHVLTRRQSEIAQLLQFGKTNRDISHDLKISESTVAHHVESILRRLGLRRPARSRPSSGRAFGFASSAMSEAPGCKRMFPELQKVVIDFETV